jgi:hypothetical protein
MRKRPLQKKHQVKANLKVPRLSKAINWTHFAEVMDELAYGK